MSIASMGDAAAANRDRQIGSHTVYVLHILEDLEIEPSPAGISAVVFGHSHKPSIEERNRVTPESGRAARAASACRPPSRALRSQRPAEGGGIIGIAAAGARF